MIAKVMTMKATTTKVATKNRIFSTRTSFNIRMVQCYDNIVPFLFMFDVDLTRYLVLNGLNQNI